MAQNPATNPMKETFEDEEYSVENEPQKQVFNQQQDAEYPKKESKHFDLAEDDGSNDGYSAFDEGTSSVAKSKKDPKNLTSGNFPRKTQDKSDDGYSSVKNTSNDGYSVPKSSKSAAQRSQVNARQPAKKGDRSESNAYAQSFEDDYSQD